VSVSERRIKNIRKPDGGFLQLLPHHELIRFQVLGGDRQVLARGVTGLTVHHAVNQANYRSASITIFSKREYPQQLRELGSAVY
jgi:hypothetical protein